MARGRNSHHGAGGGALLACTRAIERTEDQKKSVKSLQVRVKFIAEAIRPNSDIANVLQEFDGGAGADDFLSSISNRLKAVAEGNAKRMYEIANFKDAMEEVRTEVTNRQNENHEAADATDDAPDYERSIHEAVERIRQKRQNDSSQMPPEDHALNIEIREALGEKIQKKSRASRGGDDDDDDLEIVHNQNDDEHTLKCPITGMLFENPVKNNVCGHVYDRAGLDQMIKTRKLNCPIPGCTNKSLSLSQVEVDEEMKLKVKRHKTREEAEKRKRDLEEEDDDDQEGAGFTVLE
mmetsp:Transcript_32863/g.69140  ORF Transcript_32863/g.69140 Transcript_32863/m.69140 type:complete len:293 (-) Transcript_32863:1629-2507(-)|eukprot:CAMPEP_0172313694 /NCGR_PEP_ID=MMETSP1058-20130122/20778_1 /TAXON_ID=83371 /ORGANISM="Detonula confervacea, Strain CCMP 353" /LENGTH=292 /DNA_ID=CAMNT_0013027393 /DNA_START=23 /DNA_END=901 /DNA_ORIENTATION=-